MHKKQPAKYEFCLDGSKKSYKGTVVAYSPKQAMLIGILKSWKTHKNKIPLYRGMHGWRMMHVVQAARKHARVSKI